MINVILLERDRFYFWFKLKSMNLSGLHQNNLALSIVPIVRNGEGTLIAIHLEAGGELKKHKTAVPAILICVSGRVRYETVEGEQRDLQPGDLVHIPVDVEHWLLGQEQAELLLMK
jgi:quercetin dioxygenase-like cupin family protein